MASRASSNVCPECRTPQLGDSPFCESCGYRLRTQETALEGLAAISPAQLKRSSTKRRTQTQEEHAIAPARQRLQASVSIDSPSHTFVEGLPAVTPDDLIPADTLPGAVTPLGHEPLRSDTSSSGLFTRPIASADISALTPMAPPPRSAMSWLAPLCGGLMLGGILGTAFTWFALPSSPLLTQDEATTLASRALDKLAFSPGSFTKGLDEPTRVRMLRLCYKLSDDSDKECEQDILLRGEFPQHAQQLSGFMLDSLEATQGRYARCVAAGACTPADLKACQVHTTQGLQISLRVPKIMLEEDRPVVCITHAQAQEFCTWSKGRLPTQDEWEYAARGSRDARLFPWGDSWDPELANWGERDLTRTSVAGKVDGEAWTARVGAYEGGVSPFGVYDMAGNVSEWVGQEGASWQARGGSWTSAPFDLRITKRFTYDAHTRRTDVGVRCAYD